MTSSFDAYLCRLGVTVRPSPCLADLADLMARHLQAIPFENLDVVAGTRRPLNTDEVLRKVLVQWRGGFCYELNEAFRALLDHLGFRVRRIEARVWQPEAEQFGAPFDHLALVVSFPEGEFLVDVGFGDGNRCPMRLPQDQTRDISGDYHLSPTATPGRLRLTSASRPLYEMTLAAQPLEAFDAMCIYHQTSPDSIFAKGLICTRATATGRVTLSRDRLTLIEGGRRTASVISDTAAALDEHFQIRYTAIDPCQTKDTARC